jgi:hypothetical protein
MAEQAKQATGSQDLIALADRGYYEGHEMRKCELAGIVPIVPKPLTSGSKFAGRFDKRDFVYDADRDEYTCPAGQIAIRRFTSVEKDKTRHK